MNIPASALASIKDFGRERFEQLVKLPGSEKLFEAMGVPAPDAKALAGMSAEKAWQTVAELSNKALGGTADGSAAGQKAVVGFAGATPSAQGPLQVRISAAQVSVREQILERGEAIGLGKQGGLHTLQAVALLRIAARQGPIDEMTKLFHDAAKELAGGTHPSQDDAQAASLKSIEALARDDKLPSPRGFATPAAYREALLDHALAADPARGIHVGSALFSLATDTRYISNERWTREVAALPAPALATLNARATALGVGHDRAAIAEIQADIIEAVALKKGDLAGLEALFADCATQVGPGVAMNVPPSSGLLSIFRSAGVPTPNASDTQASYRAALFDAARAFDPATGSKDTARMLRDAAFLTNAVNAEVWRVGVVPGDG